MSEQKSLERRISVALNSTTIASSELGALVQETLLAITQADRTAEAERVRALDPALSPDPAAARTAMDDAAFARDRLKALLPRLEEHRTHRKAEEERDEWRAKAATLTAERDALAQEFAQTYPRAVAEFADLMQRTDALEAAIDRVNAAVPAGEGRLVGVENTARGLPPVVDRLRADLRVRATVEVVVDDEGCVAGRPKLIGINISR